MRREETEAVTKGWTKEYKSVLHMETEREEKTRKSMLPWKPEEERAGENGQHGQPGEGMTSRTVFCFGVSSRELIIICIFFFIVHLLLRLV